MNPTSIFLRKWLFIIFFAFAGTQYVVAQETAQQYLTVEEMPDLTSVLPPPPAFDSTDFTYDILRYMWGKTQRMNPERSSIAIGDAEYSLNNIIRIFSEPFGMSISFEETPEIYRLLRDFTATCDNICIKPKNYYMRMRPFVYYHEPTSTPEYEDVMVNNGSYPSGHTTLGWCVALILSEINPEQTESLMARGYMYGESRVIVGAHWQSDVDAGMLAASILNAKLHTNSAFLDQLSLAQSEFNKIKGGPSNMRGYVKESISNNNHIYDLSGYQLSTEPSKGIYIHSGKKYTSRNLSR